MDPWQRRIERAEELARRFPFSAELMDFYRDIVRFQSTMHMHDVTPLRVFGGALGAFLERVLDPREAPSACGHSGLRLHTDAEFPHIVVEACDTCGQYRKVIDMDQDPAAIYEVDDLASVPLNIWAAGQGYRNPQVNLFGL